MASLDVLDYQAGLDAALAKEGMPPGLRRAGVKEARRVVDAMAFRFALMDERPLPEDLDYVRAIEAMKRPDAAAKVLLRRQPVYAANRRRRLITTVVVLGIVGAAIAALMVAATSEEAVVLAEFTTSRSAQYNFTVTENMTRLHVDATILHPDDAISAVEIFLNGPDGEFVRLWPSTDARNNYLRQNIHPPTLKPGDWTMYVDFNAAGGSVYMTLTGVQPRG